MEKGSDNHIYIRTCFELDRDRTWIGKICHTKNIQNDK